MSDVTSERDRLRERLRELVEEWRGIEAGLRSDAPVARNDWHNVSEANGYAACIADVDAIVTELEGGRDETAT